MDTQVLSAANGWTYTWKNLDDRLQYYILEYYTKKNDGGEIIYNDKNEPRLVLIGGTLPLFSTVPDGNQGIYGFVDHLGEYPESIPDPADGTKTRIPIQKFAEEGSIVHTNSITNQEKLESIDNNARQYKVTYTLSTDANTNVITLTNSQTFDDRTYYVWLDHQTTLPDLVAQTYVEHDGSDHIKKSHSVVLKPDRLLDAEKGEYSIKGLSVSSVDAADSDNAQGNATDAFRIKADSTNALFTATKHGNYKTGTGTRTYMVKYVVDSERNPVSIIANADGKLVLASDGTTEVEDNASYNVYSWYMTIHVYNLISDGVIEYDPEAGPVILQTALDADKNLIWTLTHDAEDKNSISYTSTDPRTEGLLMNDIYRLPLYKSAVNPDMGSCADLVGIAHAGSTTVSDVSELVFMDTFESKYGIRVTPAVAEDSVPEAGASEDEDSGEGADEGIVDGIATATGVGGSVVAKLNTSRITKINRVQDHANYAGVVFVPTTGVGPVEDVFYYKIVIFAEDSTYQFYKYDDIDATEGVAMYTYFTMKSLATPTPEPTVTPSPTDTPSPSPIPSSATPSSSPAPGSGGALPSNSPTPNPTSGAGPSNSPTPNPTSGAGPSNSPTPNPTSGAGPSNSPTPNPTGGAGPSNSPTPNPTGGAGPSNSPTPNPTGGAGPSNSPTPNPTGGAGPSASPTPNPTGGAGPSNSPTPNPTGGAGSSSSPTPNPTGGAGPSNSPTPNPTNTPGQSSGEQPTPPAQIPNTGEDRIKKIWTLMLVSGSCLGLCFYKKRRRLENE